MSQVGGSVMGYFQDPVFDLVMLGKTTKGSVSRYSFAYHIVHLAARLALQINDAKQLNAGRELLHDQIARLSWKSYIWIIPLSTHSLDYSIYAARGYEDVLPNSLLGTAILYKELLNSRDPDDWCYGRSILCRGLEWSCSMAEYEGIPNPCGDMPMIDCAVLNSLFA